MKYFFLCLLLAGSLSNAMAQGIQFGADLGPNLSGGAFVKDPGTTVTGDPRPGFALGVFAEIPLATSPFSIRPRLQYSYEAYKAKLFGDDYPIHLSYLKLPIDVIYHSPLGHHKWFFGAGPFFALGLGGKFSNDGMTTTIHFGSNADTDEGKLIDAGVDLLAGYQLLKNIVLAANVNLGVVNCLNTAYWDPGCSAHTLNFGITVGYCFGKK